MARCASESPFGGGHVEQVTCEDRGGMRHGNGPLAGQEDL